MKIFDYSIDEINAAIKKYRVLSIFFLTLSLIIDLVFFLLSNYFTTDLYFLLTIPVTFIGVIGFLLIRLTKIKYLNSYLLILRKYEKNSVTDTFTFVSFVDNELIKDSISYRAYTFEKDEQEYVFKFLYSSMPVFNPGQELSISHIDDIVVEYMEVGNEK